jgi:hypothetical protein
MPRAIVNLQDPADLRAVQGQWRFAPGFIPGQPNEGLVSQAEGSPARLPDYDDSGWEICHDITPGRSHGFTFAWYRIKVTLPETVQGQDIRSGRVLFETCVDDYGEIWINGDDHGTPARAAVHHCRACCQRPAWPAWWRSFCTLRVSRLRVAHTGY